MKNSSYYTNQARRRIVYPTSLLPPLHVPVRVEDGRILVFTGIGKAFRINDDHPSLFGRHLLGHEGTWGAYAYYREATASDTAGRTVIPTIGECYAENVPYDACAAAQLREE